MSNEKYLVAKMSEREKTVAKLKANMYSTSIDELVVKAINEYNDETVKNMVCSYCNEQTIVSKKKPKECHHSVAGVEHVIKIINYPINNCCICGAEFDDMNLSVYTNDLVRFEIQKALKNRKSIPDEIDFNELIKM